MLTAIGKAFDISHKVMLWSGCAFLALCGLAVGYSAIFDREPSEKAKHDLAIAELTHRAKELRQKIDDQVRLAVFEKTKQGCADAARAANVSTKWHSAKDIADNFMNAKLSNFEKIDDVHGKLWNVDDIGYTLDTFNCVWYAPWGEYKLHHHNSGKIFAFGHVQNKY